MKDPAPILKTHQQIIVAPVGMPDAAQPAKILMISSNQKSIAIAFEDSPCISPAKEGVLVGPWGATILATRKSTREPWKDIASGRLYTIE